MTVGKLCFVSIFGFISLSPAIYAGSITASSATCNSLDGAVGTFTCGAGAAQVSSDAAINGFGFYISPTFRQFGGGRGNPNGPAPLGTIVDGSHDPGSADGTSGCTSNVTIDQHCEILTFSSTATATSIGAGSNLEFNWDNIDVNLADFSGPNGSYIDQYFVTYIIKQGANTLVDWTSNPVDFTKTGSGTGSGPTSELDLSGSGSTTVGEALNGNYTVEAILTVGWVWLGPQTGTPAAAGDQGPGVDVDISIGQGSLDIGVVPEPATIGIAGLGLALIGLGIRRKRISVR